MDFNESTQTGIKNGKCNSVAQTVQKNVSMTAGARMIILAGNCKKDFKTKITANENLFIHTFEGSSAALGRACKKPFAVSTLAIVNPGESDILSFKRT